MGRPERLLLFLFSCDQGVWELFCLLLLYAHESGRDEFLYFL